MAKRKAPLQHRPDFKGRGFAALPRVVLESPAYQDLRLSARSLLWEITARFTGNNNGRIIFSHEEASQRIGVSSPKTIVAAFKALMEHGFIDVAMESDYEARLAREYRITWLTSGKYPPYKAATNDYLDWSASATSKKYIPSKTEAVTPDFASFREDTGIDVASLREAIASKKPRETPNSPDLTHFPEGSTYMIPSPLELVAPKSISAEGVQSSPKHHYFQLPKDQIVFWGYNPKYEGTRLSECPLDPIKAKLASVENHD